MIEILTKMTIMKKVLFILFFGALFSQLFAIEGQPIQLIKTNDNGQDRTQSANISVELEGNTIEITFGSDCGVADITVETATGATMASTYCPSTPGYAEVTISVSGSYVLTIATSNGIYKGQIIIN